MASIFGSTASNYDDFQNAGINSDAVRVYLNTTSLEAGPVPAAWPTLPDGVRACVSIRPDCQQVQAGTLDNDLTTFLMGAPSGKRSYLVLWHEAASGHYPGLTSSALKAAQLYIQALSARIGANVHVGCCEFCEAPNMTDWMAKDLDFYAVDVYDVGGDKDGGTQISNFFTKVKPRTSNGHPIVAVAECNSSHEGRRPAYFQQVWEPISNNGSFMLTYWNPNGALSGPWLPDDTATINALKSIAGSEG